MKSWLKSLFISLITILWIAILVLIITNSKSTTGEVGLIIMLVLITGLTIAFVILLLYKTKKINKVLNAYANRDKKTFLFEMNYKIGMVNVFDNNLNMEKSMKLKNFAKKYLGIVENSKEYIALIIGKLDLDYYNKQYIKITENGIEKYYKFKCLLTEKGKLYGSIEQIEE